jgi:hypothetical protein
MSQRNSTALIDRLVGQRVVTQAGRDWLIAAIDPFHDTDLNVRGYPDTNLSASVLQVVKQSVTISNQTTVDADWDCHIFSLPITNTIALNGYSQSDNILFNQGASLGNFGMLTVLQNPTGADGGLTIGSSCTNAYQLSADPSYFTSTSRVVASGYEIVNTTADLYKQGQCTVYRMPQPPAQGVDYILASGTSSPTAVTGGGSLYGLNSPPETTAQAFLLSGTRQWAAREGAYMIPTFSTSSLPPYAEPNTGFDFGIIKAGPFIAASGSSGVGSITAFAQEAKHTNQNSSGVFLTGLSSSSTVTLTLNVYIEVFPSPIDTTLVVLGKPSPRYDLVAQEMYAECLCDMPSGVMVKENGLGDWFKNAVSRVSQWASPVLSAIPHPLAQAAGAGLRAANGVLNPKRNPAYRAVAPPSSLSVEELTPEEIQTVRRNRRTRSKPLPPIPRAGRKARM